MTLSISSAVAFANEIPSDLHCFHKSNCLSPVSNLNKRAFLGSKDKQLHQIAEQGSASSMKASQLGFESHLELFEWASIEASSDCNGAMKQTNNTVLATAGNRTQLYILSVVNYNV